MNDIIDFDDWRVAPYLVQTIEGFLNDPPDTPFQRGYLAAVVCVYREGLGRGIADARLIAAQRLIQEPAP
jgi:hypothetical protein